MGLKIYALYSESHRVLLEQWFRPTLPEDVELSIHFQNSGIPGAGTFRDADWMASVHAKIPLILRAIEENWGDWFVLSDVDIQFFGSFVRNLESALQNCDMACQCENPWGLFCTGFFACRGNERTRRFWIEAAEFLKNHPTLHDQDACNLCAAEHRKSLRFLQGVRKMGDWLYRLKRYELSLIFREFYFGTTNRGNCASLAYLDRRQFMGGGSFTGTRWLPGMSLPVHRSLLMHHANFTKGISHKIAQLEYVRSRMDTLRLVRP